jgi:hypothetical protein
MRKTFRETFDKLLGDIHQYPEFVWQLIDEMKFNTSGLKNNSICRDDDIPRLQGDDLSKAEHLFIKIFYNTKFLGLKNCYPLSYLKWYFPYNALVRWFNAMINTGTADIDRYLMFHIILVAMIIERTVRLHHKPVENLFLEFARHMVNEIYDEDISLFPCMMKEHVPSSYDTLSEQRVGSITITKKKTTATIHKREENENICKGKMEVAGTEIPIYQKKYLDEGVNKNIWLVETTDKSKYNSNYTPIYDKKKRGIFFISDYDIDSRLKIEPTEEMKTRKRNKVFKHSIQQENG